MKEFNLELAKAGHPVQTRDGRKVRIICWSRKGKGIKFVSEDEYVLEEFRSIVALVYDEKKDIEEVCSYTQNGELADTLIVHNSPKNLVMAPEKHEGWVNLFKDRENNIYSGNYIYNSREEAVEREGRCDVYITTCKIEWED